MTGASTGSHAIQIPAARLGLAGARPVLRHADRWARREGQAVFVQQIAVLEAAYRLHDPQAEPKTVLLRDRAVSAERTLRTRAAVLWVQLDQGGAARLEARAEDYSAEAVAYDRLLMQWAGAKSYDSPRGPTPETVVKPARRDPIDQLFESGALDGSQVQAAAEIARIYEAVTAGLLCGRSSLVKNEGRAHPHHNFEISHVIAAMHAERYLPWVRDIHANPTISLPFIIDVVVDGMSLEAARVERRMSRRRAVRQLSEGLDLYVALM
jgi:hypothetical protein